MTKVLLNPYFVEMLKDMESVFKNFDIDYYLVGAVASGFTYMYMGFGLFYVVSLFLVVVIFYDFYKLKLSRYLSNKRSKMETEQLETIAKPLPNIPEHKKKRTQEEVPAY